jgi:hypothetical protein
VKVSRNRSFAVLAFLCLTLSAVALAADKVEAIGALTKAPDAVRAAVSEKGYRVTLADGKVAAELWPAKDVAAGSTAAGNDADAGAALYPTLTVGVFAGVITLPNGGQDFRGQKIAAGTYTLRYCLLPSDGNHMGVAPNRDFFLLVPVDSDTAPATIIPYARLVKMSAKAAATNHPAAFQLAATGATSPGVASDEQKHVIFTFELSVGGKKTPVGIIVVGTAEQ